MIDDEMKLNAALMSYCELPFNYSWVEVRDYVHEELNVTMLTFSSL